MNKRVGVLVLLVVSILFIGESARLQFPGVLFANGDLESMEVGLSMTPGSADLNFRLARTYHNLMLSDGDKESSLFIKSIEQNPLLASSWLELSDVLIGLGEDKKAYLALKRAREIASLSIARLWQGSILALRLGKEDMAFENFRIVAHADPDLRQRVFETSWLLSDEPEIVFDKVVSDEILVSYIEFLMSTNRADASLLVWEKIKENGIIRPGDLFIKYIDFLIDNKRSKRAYAIWEEVVGDSQSDNLIWNSGFEQKPLNGGFDWRIIDNNREEMLIDLDSGKSVEGNKSLKVEFNGKHNVDLYHVYQIVPVETNRDYLFTARINTEDITTKNGISWEIHCYPDWRIMSKSTESLTGTNSWTNISMRLQIPESCEDLMVRVRRFKSDKFDKFISGTSWIDEVSLVDLGNS